MDDAVTAPDRHDNVTTATATEGYELWRVLYCKDDIDAPEDLLPSTHDTTTTTAVRAVGLARGAWREVNRNVPARFRTDAAPPRFVSVGRRSGNNRQGPVAVLVGLKYGGNVGTIVRSAVQSGVFEAVHLVAERGARKAESVSALYDKEYRPEKNADGPSDHDVGYYSMWNAPLLEIRRFATVDDWLAVVEDDRATVCLDLGEDSISLYSPEAVRLFQSSAGQAMYLVIGAEDTGCPSKIVDRATALLEIPSMSASINVSCAFMACLSAMLLSRSMMI